MLKYCFLKKNQTQDFEVCYIYAYKGVNIGVYKKPYK